MNRIRGVQLSRRELLALTGATLLATLFRRAPLSALAQPTLTTRVALHTYDAQTTTPSTAVLAALEAATDLRWLAPGESVFLKVASNSNRPPPAVTSPQVLEPIIRRLREAGAGTIYVGDMSGAFFVRHLADQTIGSTRENMRQNGLLQAAEDAGAIVHCFEEVPFDRAYIPATPPGAHHWGSDLRVAEILDRVDHVINLPRLGSHVLAGYTLGLKNAIGWVSDHSRMVLHRDGDLFQARIAEVNAIPQLRDKLRLTLTLVDWALTTYGPDTGYRLPLARPVIVASDDIISHDQIALLTLLWARGQTPAADRAQDPYPAQTNGFNWAFVRTVWGGEAVAEYRDLPTADDLSDTETEMHINDAFTILHGRRPDRIDVQISGAAADPGLIERLTSRPEIGVTLVSGVSA